MPNDQNELTTMMQTSGGTTYTGNLNSNTLGSVTIWPPYQYEWPYQQQVYYYTTPPSWCSGNVHVFGCEHAETCRCGKAKRDKPVCGHCGK